MKFPQFVQIRQAFRGPTIEDVAAEVERELASLQLGGKIAKGQSVAITAGSRGIANITTILRALVAHLQGIGAEPFLVPAMGSHGGGTVEGQLDVLKTLGITEASMGCPIRASMETVVVSEAPEGFPIYCDRQAYEADHLVVCNRVKLHTMFTGNIQSGLFKMMFTGLGKHDGARTYHQAAVNYPFAQIVRGIGAAMIEKCSVVAGLAIVENGQNQTAQIAAIAPQDFEKRESELLALSADWMVKLPFDDADVLLLDEIGKTISGTGMDTNVVGRKFNDHAAVEGETPRIKRIAVRNVVHGNANGLGIAEFCTKRALEATDLAATRINSLTSNHPAAGMLPHDYETDREMLEAALATIGLTPPDQARMVWARNTKDLEQLACSVAYLDEIASRDDLELLGDPFELTFDDAGDLPEHVDD
ncbi:MAG: DUF362 domain-containing protein [Planctomycetota bacterium]|nr:MAG: DUF362 domain-containing protein [Planctomycetota bacterium]REJ89987.1 MAG: DUF362 domain-containing protein [Planctomycetota bacterium]